MRIVPALAVLAMALPAAADLAAQSIEMSEWPVEWEGRPRDPYVAPDGKVWFVGQAGNYIANFDPQSENFRRFEIPEGTHPHNLIVDGQGVVWYAGNRNATIGRLDPATGESKAYPMPDPGARDPHTLTETGDGNIWFTVQGGNYIGRLNKASGKVDLVSVPVEGARPYGIWLDSNDEPWVVLFGSNRIAHVEPSTLELTMHEIPREGARPRRMAITPDDRVWYVDYAEGYLGVLDPRTGQFEEWRAPAAEQSRPYAMTVDDQNRLWFFETGITPNRLVGFDPQSEEFFGMTEVSGERNTVRHMVFDPRTSSIWFGTDTNNLGRAKIGS